MNEGGLAVRPSRTYTTVSWLALPASRLSPPPLATPAMVDTKRIPGAPPLRWHRPPNLAMSLADLKFEVGRAFEEEIWRKWGVCTKADDMDHAEFHLVDKFTRSKIKLTPESTGTVLLSCFGSRASLYKVQQLQLVLQILNFILRSGLLSIIKGGHISVPEFNLYLLLWGSGVQTLVMN